MLDNGAPLEPKIISLDRLSGLTREAAVNADVLCFEATDDVPSPGQLPIRIDALVIQLCCGYGRIMIDMVEYDIRPGTVIITQPKNYYGALYLSEGYRGHIIVCSKDFGEIVLRHLPELLPLLVQHRATPVHQFSDKEFARALRYYDFLSSVEAPLLETAQQEKRNLLQALLFYIMGFASKQPGPTIKKSRKEQILTDFIFAVSEHFHENRQVAFYAEELCISPKHLSTVVKEMSGRTAGEWIENFVIMEAKVLLKNTNLSVQEIAARLHFANQSFFGKYFRHLTGESPTNFRRNAVQE